MDVREKKLSRVVEKFERILMKMGKKGIKLIQDHKMYWKMGEKLI